VVPSRDSAGVRLTTRNERPCDYREARLSPLENLIGFVQDGQRQAQAQVGRLCLCACRRARQQGLEQGIVRTVAYLIDQGARDTVEASRFCAPSPLAVGKGQEHPQGDVGVLLRGEFGDAILGYRNLPSKRISDGYALPRISHFCRVYAVVKVSTDYEPSHFSIANLYHTCPDLSNYPYSTLYCSATHDTLSVTFTREVSQCDPNFRKRTRVDFNCTRACVYFCRQEACFASSQFPKFHDNVLRVG